MTDVAGAPLNEFTLILIAGFVVLSATALVGLGAFVALRPRLKLNRRMAALGLTGGAKPGRLAKSRDPEQRRIQQRLQELEEKGKERRKRYQIRAAMMRAGLEEWGAQGYWFIAAVVCVIAPAIYLFMGYPAMGAPAVAAIAAIILPNVILQAIAARRQAAFTREFANAIDILVRGVRSGLPVTECLAIIGREIADPLGEEFRRLVEGQKMGLTLEQVLSRSLERMPTAEYKFFAIVIQVQQQTGGSLSDTLANLSKVLRDRKKMRDKASAMASEAKASATIIGSLPVVSGFLLSLINPDYLSVFFTSTLGKTLFYGGLLWMGVGMLVMRKMIHFRI
jgi:tight adherence protein B